MGELQVEVEKKAETAFEERSKVVGIIFEKRALVVGRHDGLPMNMPPIAVVADAYVFHLHARSLLSRGAFDGDGEGLWPIGSGDDAAVAVGLLYEMVVLL